MKFKAALAWRLDLLCRLNTQPILGRVLPANTNICITFVRRWSNIAQKLYKCFVFTVLLPRPPAEMVWIPHHHGSAWVRTRVEHNGLNYCMTIVYVYAKTTDCRLSFHWWTANTFTFSLKIPWSNDVCCAGLFILLHDLFALLSPPFCQWISGIINLISVHIVYISVHNFLRFSVTLELVSQPVVQQIVY